MRLFHWLLRVGSTWKKPVMESSGSNEHLIKLMNLISRMLEEGSWEHDTIEHGLRAR